MAGCQTRARREKKGPRFLARLACFEAGRADHFLAKALISTPISSQIVIVPRIHSFRRPSVVPSIV